MSGPEIDSAVGGQRTALPGAAGKTAGASEAALMIASAALWLGIAILGAMGQWFVALFVMLALMLVYGIVGSARDGRFDLRLIAFPVLVWLLLWAASFALAQRAAATAVAQPHGGWTLLGLHPSFAWIVLLYWLAPSLLMSLGFLAVKDRWLPQQRWDDFVRQVAARDERDERAPR